ncbi:MAG: protein translocase subunit SecF [Phycisphaerales bacterium]
MVAVSLSFVLILIYIWVRFGSVRYSLAAIIALIHDVLTAIGLIALAEIIYENHFLESFAAAIGIEPFKIDLNLVAALLTIVGYSLNDTIIIMDRIRENRGKLPYASRETINLAINQTVSRTLITSGTTLIAVLILYIFGGAGVRAFSYALLVGVIVGTYSSIAVASPLVWSGKSDKSYRGKGKSPA